MIQNLKERADFWGGRDKGGFEGSSDPAFTKHRAIFAGVSVLEIGPGEGRQFLELSKGARRYSVADISPEVLGKEVFAGAPRHRITSYDEDLCDRFDVVTCWYVLHHVRHEELDAFLRFAARHLVAGGSFYFNIADQSHPLAISNDGIGTTPHDLAMVIKRLVETGFVIVDVERISYECLNLLARKAP